MAKNWKGVNVREETFDLIHRAKDFSAETYDEVLIRALSLYIKQREKEQTNLKSNMSEQDFNLLVFGEDVPKDTKFVSLWCSKVLGTTKNRVGFEIIFQTFAQMDLTEFYSYCVETEPVFRVRMKKPEDVRKVKSILNIRQYSRNIIDTVTDTDIVFSHWFSIRLNEMYPTVLVGVHERGSW